MSIRDADLCEALLHRVATRFEHLRVLEWGTGASTLWYSSYLRRLGVPFTWAAIEHYRAFFDGEAHPGLAAYDDTTVIHLGRGDVEPDVPAPSDHGVTAYVFDAGEVRPDRPGRAVDRLVNLDAYVALPSRLGGVFDYVMVDGRKRRRCLLEAAQLVSATGYVVLHDAWRTHYQCAWPAFASSSRFGDECWIGAQRTTDFTDVLPWHAFERHEDPPGDTQS